MKSNPMEKMLYKSLEDFCKIFPRMDNGKNFDYGTIEVKNSSAADTEFILHQWLSISDNAMISGIKMQDVYSKDRSKKGREGWQEDEQGNTGLKPTWIPIGNSNACLIFSKTEIDNYPVYGIITGSFEPFLIADNLAVYFDCLGEIMRI